MVAYLGVPPIEFQNRSEHAHRVFNEDGTFKILFVDISRGELQLTFSIPGSWKGSPPLPSLSLEQAETCLVGQRKTDFLNFMGSMLEWMPEKRKTAKDLWNDPWVSSDA
jgi:hypothetical protein